MLRQTGFLNFTQLLELVYREFAAEISELSTEGELFEDEQIDFTPEERARVWALFQWRTIIDRANEVYLLLETIDTARLDAVFVLQTVDGAEHLAFDIDLHSPLTRERLRNFERKLLLSWKYVDPLLGVIKLPQKSFWSRTAADNITRQLEDRLRIYDGRTVAISESDATDSIFWIKGVLAQTKPKPPDAEKWSNVFQTYMQAYPDGKGTATWEEVETRTGYSRRHLLRAIKKFQGDE